MRSPRRRPLVILTLLLAGFVDRAWPHPHRSPGLRPWRRPDTRRPWSSTRLTWSYYQQARIDSFQVYVWSRLMLDSRREMGETPATGSPR